MQCLPALYDIPSEFISLTKTVAKKIENKPCWIILGATVYAYFFSPNNAFIVFIGGGNWQQSGGGGGGSHPKQRRGQK
ncbi:unnamed protein product [Rotaria socialis]|uniref:Uncharacterized protein n=1 Tax=Rotaria socialis TaxID=392032 RepID=A0A821CME3_9BILA|nr:unnamed protein product [Rotaria socialis]